MKKILLSLGTIVFVGGLIAGATGAFFSDTETSTGNVFAAGAIDLKIDNESYVTDIRTGKLVRSPETTWGLSNLTDQLFFNFRDVKPGDLGEDTISIHVTDNDAWVCMAADITSTPENGIVDPEADANDQTDGSDGGELQNYLQFAFWHDDGDNVLEKNETDSIFWNGPASQLFDGYWHAIADSTDDGSPLSGAQKTYIAKAWCFGTLTEEAVDEGLGDDGPLGVNGTGFDCNGAGDGDQNDAQTDSLTVDVSFYAVQSRNNDSFLCSSLDKFEGEAPQAPKVGAALGDFSAPSAPSCNTTVSGAGSIQTAVNGVGINGTVCVDGTYNGNGDNAAVLIETAGVTLAATTQGVDLHYPVVLSADGVTVTGFDGKIGQAESASEVAAFYLDNDATNATISYNNVVGTGSGAAILTESGADNSGGLIEHNTLRGAVQGIYLNPHTGLITIQHNDIDDNVAGIGNLTGALVQYNEFDHSMAAAEAIGAGTGSFGNYDGSIIQFNNFLNGTMINDYPDPTITIDAENNFFNLNGATQAPSNVDFTPEAGVMFPHN